jgi:hypothetical protein
MLCDSEAQDTPTVVADDEKAIERAEGDRRNREEVHRGNRFTVIAEKGKPAPGWLQISRRPFLLNDHSEDPFLNLGVITEQWREGGYVIDFKVGQSFGDAMLLLRLTSSRAVSFFSGSVWVSSAVIRLFRAVIVSLIASVLSFRLLPCPRAFCVRHLNTRVVRV